MVGDNSWMMANITPAMPAMTDEAAHATACTRAALTPISIAVRSSLATARIATPNRDQRKKA